MIINLFIHAAHPQQTESCNPVPSHITMSMFHKAFLLIDISVLENGLLGHVFCFFCFGTEPSNLADMRYWPRCLNSFLLHSVHVSLFPYQ